MFELTYFSSANSELTSSDISSLLENSRVFNSRHKITGCLLYYNHEFLQIIEGEKEVVQGLFAKIKQDKRHKNVILLGEGPTEKRTFPDWSMSYHKIESGVEKNKFLKNNVANFSELARKPTHVTELFWTMAKYIVN